MKFVDLALPVPKHATYTYAVHPSLENVVRPGHRASVRFGGRMVIGTVIGLHNTPYAGKTETILELLEQTPFFPDFLLTLADALSKQMLAPIGLVLHVMSSGIRMPGRRKPRLSGRSKQPDIPFCDCSIPMELARSGTTALFVDEVRKPGNYLEALEKLLSSGEGVIFLVPHIALVEYWETKFAALNQPFTVLHSGLSPAAKHRAWTSLSEGKARLVLGTRQAVFAPIAGPGHILIMDCDSPGFQEETGLDYHALHVARLRSDLQGFGLTLSSPAPQVTVFHRTYPQECRIYPQAVGKENGRWELMLADNIYRHTRFLELIHRSAETVRHEKSLFLYPAKGYLRHTTCGSCGRPRLCMKCGVTLVYSREQSAHCPRCKASAEGTICPACHSASLRFSVSGREHMAEFIRERLGGIPLHSSDKTDFSVTDTGVFLGPLNLYQPLPEKTGILVLIHPDLMLLRDDFRGAEAFFQTMRRAWLQLGMRKNLKLFVFLRSLDPAHSLNLSWQGRFDALPLEFYNQELKLREAFGYPPFGLLCEINTAFSTPEQEQKWLPGLKKSMENLDKISGIPPLSAFPGIRSGGTGKASYKSIYLVAHHDADRFREILLGIVKTSRVHLRIRFHE
ncbi:MAG: hypothetical protein PHQ23_14885 [Candidatus Wallbacteria bacterium]|nr:hypothetical protein [Candidatus Wallbacteria bacterium]